MMVGAPCRARWVQTRRSRALLQLLLFLFTSATPLLPCAHAQGHAGGHAVVPASSGRSGQEGGTEEEAGGRIQHNHPHMAQHEEMAAPSAPSPDPAPAPSHHSTDSTMCLWVMGCAGAVSVHDADAWVAATFAVPDADPMGVVLQRVSTHRAPEVPPPRG